MRRQKILWNRTLHINTGNNETGRTKDIHVLWFNITVLVDPSYIDIIKRKSLYFIKVSKEE